MEVLSENESQNSDILPNEEYNTSLSMFTDLASSTITEGNILVDITHNDENSLKKLKNTEILNLHRSNGDNLDDRILELVVDENELSNIFYLLVSVY